MENKVLQIMSKSLNVNISDLSNQTSKKDLAQWDSMTHLNLIVDIETELNITFDNDEIISIIDFNSLMKIIINKLEKM